MPDASVFVTSAQASGVAMVHDEESKVQVMRGGYRMDWGGVQADT